MGRGRKRYFQTWADAEIAYKGASKVAYALDIALRDVLTGKVKWLEGLQPRKVGLCRLSDVNGGVVIIVDREQIGAMYLEEWLREVDNRPAPKGRKYMPEYKAWEDVQLLAARARLEQTMALAKTEEEAKGCERVPIPPEVDQNIRTY